MVPKAIRERLGLTPGARVELTERDGTLEIAPVPSPVRVGGEPGREVFACDEALPVLTAESVRDALERTRR